MNQTTITQARVRMLSIITIVSFALFLVTPVQSAPKQGGSLVVPIIVPAFTENFNPFSTQGEYIKGVMYEPLVIYNPMAGEIDYRLAESFSYSEDLKTITYTLRDNLKWSDGKPITTDDVIFSFDLARDNQAFDAGSLFASKRLKAVEKVDKLRFRLVLNEVDTTVEWSIPNYYILPAHVFSKVDDIKSFANSNPVGSGPITQVEYVKPQQMKLCRNPHYYLEGRPYLDCIVYRAFSDNTQIQPALMNNEIDWGSNFIAEVEKTYVAKDPEHHKFWYPANDAINIYFNTKQKPFSDIAFRQAFSMSLDREAIVDLAAYGYPTVTTFPGGIGTYFSDSISKRVAEEYGYLNEYNPKRAMKLLDDAGYKDKDGDGFRENPDGSKIDFGIMVVNGWTDWVQTVQMVTEFLAEVGIKARVNAVDWGVYDGSLKQGTYETAINWSLLAVDPIQTYEAYYHTSRIGQIWHANHGVNLRKLDQLIEEYGRINDTQRKADILEELQEVTAQKLPFIGLFSNPTWFQYNTTRIEGWPSEDNPYVHPVWYDLGKRLIVFNELYAK